MADSARVTGAAAIYPPVFSLSAESVEQRARYQASVTADAITPPPRQRSPSYSTALWPGVTAH